MNENAYRVTTIKFSQLEEFGARLIRAVSRKGLAVNITLSVLSLNTYQMMRRA